MVTVGHNATVFIHNRIPTEQEETAKLRSEGDMQRDPSYWCQAWSGLPPGCHWWLWRSAFSLTEPFHHTHLWQPHSTPGFAKLSPLWGGAGFYFGFTISLGLCPLAFASVSRRVKALFTTQHCRTIGSLLVWSNSPFSTPYASYQSLRHACGHTSTWGPEVSKPWPISAVSVKFCQVAAEETPRDVSAEIHAPYKLYEPTTMDKTRFTGTARTNYKKSL